MRIEDPDLQIAVAREEVLAWLQSKQPGTHGSNAQTVMRVIDDDSSDFDMRKFKKSLERSLKQDTVLIVERGVGLFS